jgi:hypothetical protein
MTHTKKKENIIMNIRKERHFDNVLKQKMMII